MPGFSRTQRLLSKKDFQLVFAKPHKVTRQHLIALYRSNQLPHARLGIIIAKHHVKTAVRRNRIRRVIRESFRHQEMLKGLDIIVLMRSEWTPLINQTLRDDINNLWQAIRSSQKPS